MRPHLIYMKIINYIVLIYIENIDRGCEVDGTLKAFLHSRGYTSLSSSLVHSCALLTGAESQVMSKSESVTDGAGYLRKRLLKMIKKVPQDHTLSGRITLVISPSDVTTLYHPRKRTGSVRRKGAPGAPVTD